MEIVMNKDIEGNSPTPDKQAYDSGFLEITTIYKELSPIPSGKNQEKRISIEFGIVPIQDDKLIYDQMIVIRSNDQGQSLIELPPGKYWIGGTQNTQNFTAPIQIRGKAVTVHPNSFTQIKLWEIGLTS